MSKSIIYVANTGAQNVPVGGAVNLGGVVRRFGCALDLNGNSVTIDEAGYYDVDVSVTAAPTAAGEVTVTLFNNGVAVPGATATTTATAADDTVSISFNAVVRVFCGANAGALTLVLTGTASSVANAIIVVTKL